MAAVTGDPLLRDGCDDCSFHHFQYDPGHVWHGERIIYGYFSLINNRVTQQESDIEALKKSLTTNYRIVRITI